MVVVVATTTLGVVETSTAQRMLTRVKSIACCYCCRPRLNCGTPSALLAVPPRACPLSTRSECSRLQTQPPATPLHEPSASFRLSLSLSFRTLSLALP